MDLKDMNLTNGPLESNIFGHTGYQDRRPESVSPASFLHNVPRSDSTLYEHETAENAGGELSEFFPADQEKHDKLSEGLKQEQVEADFLGLSNYFNKPFSHAGLTEAKPLFFDVYHPAAAAAALQHTQSNAAPQAEANNGAAGRPKLIINTNFDERSLQHQQQQQQSMKGLSRSLSACTAQMVTPCTMIANSLTGLAIQSANDALKTGASEMGNGPVSAGGALRRRRTEHSNFLEGPSFQSTIQLREVYSQDLSQQFDLKIFPKIDRGFFLAQNNWTCYRRNYFQVSGGFNGVSRDGSHADVTMPCLLKLEDERFVTATSFAIGVSARVSSGESNVDIVQHTTKRDKGPIMAPQPVPVHPGGCPSSFIGPTYQEFVATFERLQFKVATANNGKKRAAQQFYTLVMELWANCESDEIDPKTGRAAELKILVATNESSHLVVRGRSPAHYPDSHQYNMLEKRNSISASPSSRVSFDLAPPVSMSDAHQMLATLTKLETQSVGLNQTAAAAAAAAAAMTASSAPSQEHTPSSQLDMVALDELKDMQRNAFGYGTQSAYGFGTGAFGKDKKAVTIKSENQQPVKQE